jgi:hypothetical protein
MEARSYIADLSKLNPMSREPGLSAFMRVRNGADFLESVVESHVAFFDEIVIVHNQCTDATAVIAERLASKHPRKIRSIHYVPRVHPPGSEGHRTEPPDSPHSYVNFNNFALAVTTRRVATKLDDDHLAITRAFARMESDLRRWPYSENAMICFSGLNLAAGPAGELGILRNEPFSGNGDIGFFRVSEQSRFSWDPRFTRFEHRHLRMRYHSLVYWHVKYLKTGYGFANYELDRNPTSRYQKRYTRFMRHREIEGIRAFLHKKSAAQSALRIVLSIVPPALGGKRRLKMDRSARLSSAIRSEDLAELRAMLPKGTVLVGDSAV